MPEECGLNIQDSNAAVESVLDAKFSKYIHDQETRSRWRIRLNIALLIVLVVVGVIVVRCAPE